MRSGISMSLTSARSLGKLRPKASVTYLHEAFTPRPATRSTMKAISCNRLSTATQSHGSCAVMLDCTRRRILGNGERGIVDAADTKARLSFPNGIVSHPWSQRLYINEFANETPSSLPPRAIVREIILGADQP